MNLRSISQLQDEKTFDSLTSDKLFTPIRYEIISSMKFLKRVVILFSVLALFLYIYSESDDSLYSLFHNDPPIVVLKSEHQGFPIVEGSGNLSIYAFNERRLKSTNIKVFGSNSLGGLGSSSPKVSPDFLYTAFIDQEKRDLWIISNQTLEKTQVTRNGEIAGGIVAWSPDGKKIIYTTEYNAIPEEGGFEGEKLVKSKPRIKQARGYYLFNIETGKSIKLPELRYFSGFLDSDRILIRNSVEYGNKTITLDLNTFNTDDSTTPGFSSNGISQYDIAEDLKKWTFNLGTHFTARGESSVVLADFPKMEGGLVIDNGNWADLQFPKLSPSSTKVAYIKKENESLDHPKYGIMVYDTLKHQKQRYAEGNAFTWFDDNNLIIYSTEDRKNYLLNLIENTKNKLN